MQKTVRILIHTVAALALIAAGFAGFKILKQSREALGRQQPETPLPLVRTVPVTTGPVDVKVTGEGTVQSLAETSIVPQVSGKVVRVSDNLVNGGRFEKGELLLAIEPADYEIAVTLARANVKDAESKYETALQESRASKEEWKRINPGEKVPPLVAKEPQLEAARANLEAQRANLEKALLNLERTRITAPFDGRCSKKNVDTGQYVTPGQVVATVYATRAVEISVPLENEDLKWIDVPGFTVRHNPGAEAEVRARVAGRDMTWQGRVDRVQGKINTDTRMVNVVIRVPEPYETMPPLSVGQFVSVNIKGKTIDNAAIIPRAALHGKNTVWTVTPDDGRMHFTTVTIARMDERGVVVKSGLTESRLVVISPLKAATDGMEVRHVDAHNGGRS